MDIKTLQQRRIDDMLKAVNRQEPDYIPVLANVEASVVGYSGTTLRQAMSDPELYVQAMCKFYDDLYCDTSIYPFPTVFPNAMDIMGFSQFRLGPDDTAIEHVQQSHMKPEEYPQLIEDFNGFVSNVLLPRKYPFLFDAPIEETKERLKALLGEIGYTYFALGDCMMPIFDEKYGLAPFAAGLSPHPAIDVLFDTLRGFKGVMMDLRRRPADVKNACEVIWNERMMPLFMEPVEAPYPFYQQVPHIPAYLSPKQFGELYWPQEKMILEKMAAAGNKMAVVLEGKWSHILDYLLDAPKDSMILMVDDDDIFEVNKRVGHHQIIAGGAKSAMLKLQDKQSCIDYAKRVIDELAPGGGFIFTLDKPLLCAADCCPNLFEVYNFAHEYGKK